MDGGSEFQAAFEMECQRRGLKLFVLPPRSPKLNGCVEWSQRTHTEEFYDVNDFSLEVATLNRELLAWEHVYNTVRPHHGPWATSPPGLSASVGTRNTLLTKKTARQAKRRPTSRLPLSTLVF